MGMKENPTRVVSVADSALDTLTMGPKWTEYIKTRDPQMVREIPGKKLTWFVLRQIPTSIFMSFVQAGSNESMKYTRAFQCGVAEIENYDDGGIVANVRPDHELKTGSGEILVWKDSFIDTLPPVWVEEIGSVVFANSFLAGTSVGFYRPPPSLPHVLVARASLDVERLMEQERLTNAKPATSPAETPPDTSPSDAGSDATATG